MHKIFSTLLVGSVVVGGVVLVKGASAAATPEGKTCIKLQAMCPPENRAKPQTLDECVEDMKDLRKMAGNASFEKSAKCIDESDSCAAASGCLVGGAGMGIVGEMFKGLGNAMTK